MSSTLKTSNLLLNKWLGTDKPKKDDFNSDNEKIDAALGLMSMDVQTAQQAAQQAANQLDGHVGDAEVHVTAAEKDRWNTSGSEAIIGSYTGTGAYQLKIQLGFMPRLGFLFAVGYGLSTLDWSTGESNVYAGFFSEQGSGKFFTIENDGFTINHNATAPPNGSGLKLNLLGVTYVYVVWK